MKKIFYFIIPAMFALSIVSTGLAQTNYGLDTTAGEIDAFKAQAASQQSGRVFLQSKVGSIISLVLSFIGILFFALIIYAGLMWMLAQGNQQKVDQAKDLIINAIIGLVIIFSAYAITSFIGNQISN
jgi:cbb3-type cytochrome oxidase subunit 3